MQGNINLASSKNALRKVRGRLVTLIKCCLATGIVAWLCSGPLDLRSLAQIAPSPMLAVLVTLIASTMVLPAIRWYWLLRIQEIDATVWQAIKLTWAGYLATTVLPGAMGGDVAKSVLIVRRNPEQRLRSLSTVVVDRMIGVFSLILLGAMAAVAFLPSGQLGTAGITLAWTGSGVIVTAAAVVAFIAMFPTHPAIAHLLPDAWVRAWRDSRQLYFASKQGMLGCLGLSLISGVLTASSFVAADRVLGGGVEWSAGLLVGPLVVLANCLPITPGGVGVAEAASSELFARFACANGAEMMLITRLLMVVMSLPALLGLFGQRQLRISPAPRLAQRLDESPVAATNVDDFSKAA